MSKYLTPIMPKFFKDSTMPRRMVGSMLQKAKKSSPRRSILSTFGADTASPASTELMGYDFTGLQQLSSRDLQTLAENPDLRQDFFARNPRMIGALRRQAGDLKAKNIKGSRATAINWLVDSLNVKPIAPRKNTAIQGKSRVISLNNMDEETTRRFGERLTNQAQRSLNGNRYVPTRLLQRSINDIDSKIDGLRAQQKDASAQTSRAINQDIEALRFERQRVQGVIRERNAPFVQEKLTPIKTLKSQVGRIDREIGDLTDELKLSPGESGRALEQEIVELQGRRAELQQTVESAKNSPWYIRNQGRTVSRLRKEPGASIKSPEAQGFGGRPYMVTRQDRKNVFNQVSDDARTVRNGRTSPAPVDIVPEPPTPTPVSSATSTSNVGATPRRGRGRPRKNNTVSTLGAQPSRRGNQPPLTGNAFIDNLKSTGLLRDTRRVSTISSQSPKLVGLADGRRAPSPSAMLAMAGEIPEDLAYASRMVKKPNAGQIIGVNGKLYEVVDGKAIPEYDARAIPEWGIDYERNPLLRAETVSESKYAPSVSNSRTGKPVFGVGNAENPVMQIVEDKKGNVVMSSFEDAPSVRSGKTPTMSDGVDYDAVLQRARGRRDLRNALRAEGYDIVSSRTPRTTRSSKPSSLFYLGSKQWWTQPLRAFAKPKRTATTSMPAVAETMSSAIPDTTRTGAVPSSGKRKMRFKVFVPPTGEPRVSTFGVMTPSEPAITPEPKPTSTRRFGVMTPSEPTPKPVEPSGKILSPSFDRKSRSVTPASTVADDVFEEIRPTTGAFTNWGDVKREWDEGVRKPLASMKNPKQGKLNALLAAKEGVGRTASAVGNLPYVRGAKRLVPKSRVGKVAAGIATLYALSQAVNAGASLLPRAKKEPEPTSISSSNIFDKRMKKRVTKNAYSNTMMKSAKTITKNATKISKKTPTPHASRNVSAKHAQKLTFDGIKVGNKYF